MNRGDLKVIDNANSPDSPKGKLILVKLNTLTTRQRVNLPPDALVVADKLCGHCHATGRFAGRPCPCLKVMITPYKTQIRNEPGEPIQTRIVPDLGQEKPLETKDSHGK